MAIKFCESKELKAQRFVKELIPDLISNGYKVVREGIGRLPYEDPGYEIFKIFDPSKAGRDKGFSINRGWYDYVCRVASGNCSTRGVSIRVCGTDHFKKLKRIIKDNSLVKQGLDFDVNVELVEDEPMIVYPNRASYD